MKDYKLNWLDQWICGWVGLAQGLATVITFGAWRPSWSLAIVLRRAQVRFREANPRVSE